MFTYAAMEKKIWDTNEDKGKSMIMHCSCCGRQKGMPRT